MTNKFKISILILILLFSFSFIHAESCPVKTVGLSKSNYSGKQGEVLALQMMLATQPEIYPEGTMSGTFGPATERAIKKLQTDSGLSSTGKLDLDTIETVQSQYILCTRRI